MAQEQYSIGVDIGGTKIAAALCRSEAVEEQRELPTPVDSRDELLSTIFELIQPWLKETHLIGVCTPGWHDPRSGRIRLASNIPALTGADLAAELDDLLGVPVAVGNDADAAALAEFRLGAARDWDSVFFTTVSTGIGGGHVSPAGVLRGNSGAAAEIGHMIVRPGGAECTCGARGCLEAYSSGKSIARRASERSRRQLSSVEVLEMWRSGDSVAAAVVIEAAQALATGLAIVSQLLDPEGLVLGGGVANGNPDFCELVRDEFTEVMVDRRLPEIRQAALGASAGMLGAALLPLELP